MAVCEDAPACGCCGPALDAADDLSALERYYDGDDFYESDDPDAAWDEDDESDDDPREGDIDGAMESALFGGDA